MPPLSDFRYIPNEYIKIEFYITNTFKLILFCIFAIPLLPFTLYFLLWSPNSLNRILKSRIYDPGLAEYAILQGFDGKYTQVKIYIKKQNTESMFLYKKHPYHLVDGEFQRVDGTLFRFPVNELLKLKDGLFDDEIPELRRRFGGNKMEIVTKSVTLTFLKKLMHPMYLFQIGAVIEWYFYEYVVYSSVILVFSILTILVEIYITKRNRDLIRRTNQKDELCIVVRNNQLKKIPTKDLVIGDIVGLADGMKVGADLAVLNGSCLVNTTALTGEEAPEVKVHLSPYDKEPLIKLRDNRHVIYAGSTILYVVPSELNSLVFGLVLATGYYTSKGEVYRSVIYHKEVTHRVMREATRYLLMMILFALVACIFQGYQSSRHNRTASEIARQAFDLVTIAIPPLLTLVLRLGTIFVLFRLKSKGITCIKHASIKFIGWLQVMCFDKTGTITETNMECNGFISCNQCEISTQATFDFRLDKRILEVMVTCHALIAIGKQLQGAALDISMFKSTLWDLETDEGSIEIFGKSVPIIAKMKNPKAKTIHVLKRYGFESSKERCTVVYVKEFLKGKSSGFEVMASSKGSPEVIYESCTQSSVPTDYFDVANSYAAKGMYVIALAMKKINPDLESTQQLTYFERESIERNMTFIGFLLFVAPVKNDAYDIFSSLKQSGIKTVIMSGDSPFTTMAVYRQLVAKTETVLVDLEVYTGDPVFKPVNKAKDVIDDPNTWHDLDELPSFMAERKDSGLVLCITGLALDHVINNYEKGYVDWLIQSTLLYARVKPAQKTLIIENLRLQGIYTGMVGDGSNDVGALKSAHFGMALSSGEASMIAPFASEKKQLKDLHELLIEGRCAVESAFTFFKYMIIYPITQYVIAMITTYYNSTQSTYEFMFDDIGLVMILSIFMSTTGPTPKLVKTKLPDSLHTWEILVSIFGQSFFFLLFTIISHFIMKAQPWYCPVEVAILKADPTYTPMDPNNLNETHRECYNINLKTDIFDGMVFASHETMFTWLFAHFQYVISAFAFSLSAIHRKKVWSNIPFLVWCALSFAVCSALLIINQGHPAYWSLKVVFGFTDDPKVTIEFRFILFGLVILNAICCVLWELYVVKLVNETMTDKKIETQVQEENKTLMNIMTSQSLNNLKASETRLRFPSKDILRSSEFLC